MTRSDKDHEIHLEPVLAYDQLAPEFRSLSDRRRAYLAAIERIVIANIPQSARALLDVGSADGTRAFRISQSVGVHKLVLLEPSAEMRKAWPPDVFGWDIRAEELSGKNDSFDAITCLWNVLGHIFPSDSRVDVLRQCARLLSPHGRLFIDVNYRYNVSHYGLLPTILRMLRDSVHRGEKKGDVIAHWRVNGANYATDGHVFTGREFRRMAHRAGLTIEKKFTVNYATGKVHQSSFAGNPLYILRRRRPSPEPDRLPEPDRVSVH